MADLADRAHEVTITTRVKAAAAGGFDPARYSNAVEEPLDEAYIERMETP
jgi:hypothetical protein